MKRVLLRASAPATMLLPRLWLSAEFALDACRALELNRHLGISRIERFGASWLGGYIRSVHLHALGWAELLLAALLVLGLLTRLAVTPALLAILAALSSWNQVGTLGTADALNATSHAIAIILAATLLLMHGAGPISLDAALTRRSRRK